MAEGADAERLWQVIVRRVVLTRSRATGVLSSSSRVSETWPLVYRSMQSGGTVKSRP